MPRMICLETEQAEVFVNLDQICQANVNADTVQILYGGGQAETFAGGAAHTLIQALRHEEKRTAQHG